MRFVAFALLLALPFSVSAKTSPEIQERDAAYKKLLDTSAQLNSLASKMNEAAAADIAVPAVAVKVRPPQISFVEQRNLISLEAVELRRDWYRYVREKLNAGESLASEPELARLYFAFLQMQIQIDRDDAERIKRLVAEAEFEASRAQAKHNFTSAIQAARADGATLGDMINKRIEHLGEIYDLKMTPEEILDRDFRESGRDQARTAKTLARIQAESDLIAKDLNLSEALLEQAKEAAVNLPVELSVAFKRPFGYPIVDRAGHFYSESEWQEMSVKLAKENPAPIQSLRASCARLLRGTRAKGQGQ